MRGATSRGGGGQVGKGRVVHIGERPFGFCSDHGRIQRSGLPLLVEVGIIGIRLLSGGFKSTAVFVNENGPPVFFVASIYAKELTPVFYWGVGAYTVRGVTSRWGRLIQIAIPRIYNRLVKLGEAVVTEPSLVIVPPYWLAFTNALLTCHTDSFWRGWRGGGRGT